MKFLRSFFVVFCTVTPVAESQMGAWEPANGGQWGPVRSIYVTPAGTLLAGADAAGIFRSSDKGSTLLNRNLGLEGSIVNSIMMDSWGVLFASASNGVFRSADLGDSWIPSGTGLPALGINEVAEGPGGRLFAGTYGRGVYSSSDGGGSWIPANQGITSVKVNCFAFAPPNSLFAGTRGDGVFLSTDFGQSWTQSNNGLTDPVIFVLLYARSGCLFAGSRGTSGGGVFRSTDGGASWSCVFTASYVSSILEKGDTVLAASMYGAIAQSVDSGRTWVPLAQPVPGIIRLASNADGDLFAGTNDGKLFRSANWGESWIRLNPNLDGSVVWSLLARSDGTIVASSTTQGLCESLDEGSSWHVLCPDLNDVRALAANSRGVMFAGRPDGSILRSEDRGITWTVADSGFGHPFVLSLAALGEYVFCTSLGGGVRVSSDSGKTWTASNTGLTDLMVRTIAVDAGRNLFAGTSGGVFRSSDTASTWYPSGMSGVVIHALTPHVDGSILAGTNDGLFRSTDSGESWQRVADAMTGMLTRSVHGCGPDTVIAGTLGWGAFFSCDGGGTWGEMNAGLASYDVYGVEVSATGRFLLATDGGVYRNTSSVPTSVCSDPTRPFSFELSQNYPNPFNPSTTISFRLPRDGEVKLRVFDLLGREVADILDGALAAGEHHLTLHMPTLASGIYLYRLEFEGSLMTRRMVLLR